MKLRTLFEDDDRDHWDKLASTGYYGAQGAGCLFLAQDSGRVLLALRSAEVEQPRTWGVLGGAIDKGESPEAAARREAQEEAGADAVKLIPLLVFRDKQFRYHNFLAVVPTEFVAHDLQRKGFVESDEFRWVKFGAWPTPLHFGVRALLADQKSIALIKSMLPAAGA